MKYLGTCMLMFIFTLNIFGDEDITNDKGVIFIQCLTVEQQEEVVEMRTKFLEGFNELKNKLISIRLETQNEMMKDNPDWNEIKKLNNEYYKLQQSLNKGMQDYKQRVQNIQIDISN